MNKIKVGWFFSFVVVVFLFAYQLGYFDGEKNVKNRDNSNLYHECSNLSKEKEDEKFIEVKVLKVIDGDTFLAQKANGEKIKVRLLGINTPEKKNPFRPQECFGLEATKEAEKVLANQKVKLYFDESQSKYDKFGRALSYVILSDGRDFGKEMIKKGFAYEYTYHGRKYQKQKEYKEVQKYAEKNKLGLWAEGACDEFDKGNR